MKALNRFSSVLKTIGVVLLCIAVVLTIYVPVNTAGYWGTYSGEMAKNGVNTNLFDRIIFDHQVFSAMSEAAVSTDGSGLRANRASAHFSAFEKRVAEQADAQTDARIDESAAYLAGEFNSEAFLKRYESREALQESAALKNVFEELNNLSAVVSKNGKKLPPKTNASLEPFFEEAYTAALAEYGESLGSYSEFMQTILSMITTENENGGNVKDASKWYSESFDFETYSVQLAALRNSDPDLEETLSDRFAALISSDTPDYKAFLTEQISVLKEKYPNDALPADDVIANAVVSALEAPSFDGSYGALLTTVQAKAKESEDASFSKASKSLGETLVSAADARASIKAIGALWMIAAWVSAIWVCAIILLIASVILRKYLTRALIDRVQVNDTENEDTLLRVEHLSQYFRSGDYINKAVDDVSFFIKKGEVFGLVGESGCGKTTTGRTIINLYDPTVGDVYFHGLRVSSTLNGLPVYKRQKRADLEAAIRALKENPNGKDVNAEIGRLKAAFRKDIADAQMHALESDAEKSKCIERYREKRVAALKKEFEADMKKLSGAEAEDRKRRFETERKLAEKDNVMTRMQMIFQDPIASINPRMTVREIIAEGLIIRGVKDKKYIDDKVNEMLDLVGLVREHADRYPHEFSGGQRQRIGIARAIAMQPDLIIADEPISALDVSIQAQVINLMNDLRDHMGLTIMFIAHNLSVVKYFSDRIGVMYFGKLVELADSDELFKNPLHPYTKALLSAIPYPDPYHEKARHRIEYDPDRTHDYSKDKPSLREIVPGHFIYCNDSEFEQYKKQLKA